MSEYFEGAKTYLYDVVQTHMDIPEEGYQSHRKQQIIFAILCGPYECVRILCGGCYTYKDKNIAQTISLGRPNSFGAKPEDLDGRKITGKQIEDNILILAR